MAKRLCPDCETQLYKENGRWYCPHCGEVEQDGEEPEGERHGLRG